MKYRCLSYEELAGLEKEFVHYLAMYTITAEDWQDLEKNNPQKALTFIESFSDKVFDRVLKKIKYMELFTPTKLRLFKCEPQQISMIVLEAMDTQNIDFTNHDSFLLILKRFQNRENTGVHIYRGKKKYATTRELELFQMLENGCMIAEGKLFEMFDKAIKKEN
ncbi:MAG: DUF6495 family protein [Chitinophagales bacterium]